MWCSCSSNSSSKGTSPTIFTDAVWSPTDLMISKHVSVAKHFARTGFIMYQFVKWEINRVFFLCLGLLFHYFTMCVICRMQGCVDLCTHTVYTLQTLENGNIGEGAASVRKLIILTTKFHRGMSCIKRKKWIEFWEERGSLTKRKDYFPYDFALLGTTCLEINLCFPLYTTKRIPYSVLIVCIY